MSDMETTCKLYLELANLVPPDCISAREFKLRDFIIEQCARILETANDETSRICLIAAIRALKDKP